MKKTIVIASDHAGFHLKKFLVEHLQNKFLVDDLGCPSQASVDYPDFAGLVAKKISQGQAEKGVLVCGTGIGMAITANKFKGVRAAAITDLFSAKMARQHNNLNILCLGARVVGQGLATEILEVFLNTPFEGGRHEARVKKIHEFEI